MSLYHRTIPQFIRTLVQAQRWLDKAEAYAEQKKFDPEVLLAARLAPDQWPLGKQLQIISTTPRRFAALFSGGELPNLPEGKATYADLRAAFAESLEKLRALKPEQFEGAEERVIPLPFAPGKGMKGDDFVFAFGFPNFYFHAVTAYAILRNNGVELGKADFLGDLPIVDL